MADNDDAAPNRAWVESNQATLDETLITNEGLREQIRPYRNCDNTIGKFNFYGANTHRNRIELSDVNKENIRLRQEIRNFEANNINGGFDDVYYSDLKILIQADLNQAMQENQLLNQELTNLRNEVHNQSDPFFEFYLEMEVNVEAALVTAREECDRLMREVERLRVL